MVSCGFSHPSRHWLSNLAAHFQPLAASCMRQQKASWMCHRSVNHFTNHYINYTVNQIKSVNQLSTSQSVNQSISCQPVSQPVNHAGKNCWMFAFRLQNLPYWRESGCRCTQPKACCTQTSAPLSTWDSGTGTQYLFLKPDIVGIVMRYERDIGGIYNQQYPTINNIRFGSNSGYNYTQISNKELHDWWLDSRVAYLDKLISTVEWYLNILKCLLLLTTD